MEVADDERTLRRARKVVWAFRLIFYSGAAIAAFLLLTASGGDDSEELIALTGRTAQGAGLVLWTHDGEPRSFHTKVTATCPDGSQYRIAWRRTEREPITFDKQTGTLDAVLLRRGTWENGVAMDAYARLQARLDGNTVRGTLRFLDHRTPYDCDSGPVSFSASR